jgi:2-dehydropantoate 2-reductase
LKFLIYGAGAIGSIFAGRLALSGYNSTVLARGKRLAELEENGVVLVNPGNNREEIVKVNVIENLLPDDIYDYIIVVMQKTQVNSILPVLSKNKSKNIVFVVNTASGYDDWVHAVGSERLMLGFPSAGGERVNGRVNYFIGKGIMRFFQTTTFSEYSVKKTERLRKIIDVFNCAGIPSVESSNMNMWQKTHVAIVTSIGNALYKYDSNNYALAKSYADIKLMVLGIKEGFAVLDKLGIKITPTKLNYFKLPVFLIAPIFRVVMGTKLAETAMAKHTAVAKSEMLCLQNEFDILIQKSGIETPSINSLRKYLT